MKEEGCNHAMMSNYFRFCNEQFDLISECTTNKQWGSSGPISDSCLAVIFQVLSKK